jgi:hypothetical protein
LNLSNLSLDLGLSGLVNLRLAGAVSFLETFPNKPIELAKRQLVCIFEDFGGDAGMGRF